MKQLLVTLFVVLALALPVSAQISTFNDSNGTSGTIYTYPGTGFQSYQDSKGNTGSVFSYGNGFQSYQFNGPNGSTSGSIYTYPGTDQQLSQPSAPVVPIAPLAPRQPVAPGWNPYGRPNR